MPLDLPPHAIVCPAQIEQPVAYASALDEAVALRRAGDQEAAHCALTRIVALEPDNADAWVQLGFAESALGAAQSARAAFLRALALAPDYDDAKLGLARLAYRAGNRSEARRWLARIGDARANDPEIAALRDALERPLAADDPWRLDVAAGYSALSNGRTPWREASLSLARRFGDRWFGVGADYARRFGSADTYGELRYSQQISAGAWGVALGGAAHPAFKPEAALRFDFATRTDAPWRFDANAAIARYAVGEVDRLGLRVGRRLGQSVVASAQAIVVRDELRDVRSGYSLAASWTGGAQQELSLSWTDAPESSEGVTVDVRAIGLGAGVQLAPDLRLRAGLLHEMRDAFDRTEFTLALAKRF